MTAPWTTPVRSRWFDRPPPADETPMEAALRRDLLAAVEWAEGLVQNEPLPIDLVRELRQTAGLFDGAMPITPHEAWLQALGRVAQMRCWLEHTTDGFGFKIVEPCDEHKPVYVVREAR